MITNRGKLSVVMPAYNEGRCIYKNLMITNEILSGIIDDYEIIAVNDGSSDNTKAEIKRAMDADSHIKGIGYLKNGGKGKAIKKGVEKSSGSYIAFLDSDLDLNPKQLAYFLEPLIENKADVAIGSKMHKQSVIDYPAIRRFISIGYFLMLKILFRLNIKDTQTGIKVFRAEVIKPIIPLIVTKGFAYDIEILVAVHRRGYKIVEMPIELIFTRGNRLGRIRLKDIIQVFNDTFAILYRVRIKKAYDQESRETVHEL